MKANNTIYSKTISEVKTMTGAKVVAITKEDSSFNSDFVLLDNNGVITQAFITRDINGKISINARYDSNSVAEALAYLNMTEEELSNNIEFIRDNNPDNTTPSTSDTMNTETKTMNEVATVEFSELSHAGQCTDIYLHNTAEIYKRYTVEAVKLVVNAFTNQGPVKLDDATAWDNLKFWISWQPVVKKALQAAVRLVKKYDHMTPTAKDIHEVTRNYAAYIVESAKHEVNA